MIINKIQATNNLHFKSRAKTKIKRNDNYNESPSKIKKTAVALGTLTGLGIAAFGIYKTIASGKVNNVINDNKTFELKDVIFNQGIAKNKTRKTFFRHNK